MGYASRSWTRCLLWDHRPLTDFWRVGRGYEKKLASLGLYTMGDIARCSLQGEELLYDLFGVNAELLIDHAWGWESCTMADIKAYRPTDHSVGSGQVLTCPYGAEQARLVVREMADALSLDLVDKGFVTDQIVLTVGYDRESLNRGGRPYLGPVTTDPYGRQIPKHAHGSENLGEYTSSTRRIVQAALALYDRIVDTGLLVRRIYLTAAHVAEEGAAALDRQLRLLEERVRERPWVVLTCFQPDQRKAGGAYVEVQGRVKRLDATAGAITLEDGREVPISYILEIKEEDTYEEMAENKI